jgi:hypothetical protein
MLESGLRLTGAAMKNAPGFASLLVANKVQNIADVQELYPDDSDTEKPFKPYYDKFILPRVQEYENSRLQALAEFRKRCFLTIPGIIATLVVSYLIIRYVTFFDDIADIVFGGMAGSIGALIYWAGSPVYKYKGRVKSDVFPLVFDFYGEHFEYQALGGMGIQSLKPSGIIPDYDSASTEDYVAGSHLGVKIELTEAELTKKTGSTKNRRNTTVFRGIFILLSMNKNFEGRTIVKRDRGAIGNWFSGAPSGMERVKLEDPVFEDKFEVYGSDQVEARYLLTTSFMERLVNLEKIVRAEQIQCSFYDDHLLLMLRSSHNRFETASIFTPATFVEDTQTILAEMREVFRIIETLKLQEQTRL